MKRFKDILRAIIKEELKSVITEKAEFGGFDSRKGGSCRVDFDGPFQGGFGSIRDRDCQNNDELSLAYQPGGTDSSVDYGPSRQANNGKNAFRRQHSASGKTSGSGGRGGGRTQQPNVINEYYSSHGGGNGRGSRGQRVNSRNCVQTDGRKKIRSRSTDHLNYSGKENIDSGTLKKMLKPFQTSGGGDSPLTSPEGRGNSRNTNMRNGTSGGGRGGRAIRR